MHGVGRVWRCCSLVVSAFSASSRECGRALAHLDDDALAVVGSSVARSGPTAVRLVVEQSKSELRAHLRYLAATHPKWFRKMATVARSLVA